MRRFQNNKPNYIISTLSWDISKIPQKCPKCYITILRLLPAAISLPFLFFLSLFYSLPAFILLLFLFCLAILFHPGKSSISHILCNIFDGLTIGFSLLSHSCFYYIMPSNRNLFKNKASTTTTNRDSEYNTHLIIKIKFIIG